MRRKGTVNLLNKPKTYESRNPWLSAVEITPFNLGFDPKAMVIENGLLSTHNFVTEDQ